MSKLTTTYLRVLAAILLGAGGSVAQAPASPTPLPEAAGSSAPKLLDRIELLGGDRLQGTILRQTDDYIEIRLGVGTVVGLEKSKVARILPAAFLESTSARKTAVAGLSPMTGHYVLHDGEGKSVGRMQSIVQIVDDQYRFTEEWHFPTKEGSTDITTLEVTDRDHRPLSCFYHERSLDNAARVTHECILRAEAQGDRLVVRRKTLTGSSKFEHVLEPTTRLPMSLAYTLRVNSDQRLHRALESVFDPKHGQFRRVELASRRRRVEWRGRPSSVRELTFVAGGVTNVEWLDDRPMPLRREVGGLHLVAVRVEAKPELRRPSVVLEPRSGLVSHRDNPHALWLPNPNWRVARLGPEQLLIESPLHSAQVGLWEMDQLASAEQVSTAIDAVERWLHLSAGNSLRITGRDRSLVRGRVAAVLQYELIQQEPGRALRHRGRAYVFRQGERWLVLACSAPREAFGELAADFDRVRDSVQLRREEFAPAPSTATVSR